MDIKAKFKGGGSFVNQRPVFSGDGQFVYVSWKNLIYCYNTKTGLRLNELIGLNDNIIGFDVINAGNYEQIIACTKSGKLATWKTDTGFRIGTKKLPFKNILGFKIHHTNLPEQAPELVLAFRNETKYSFSFYDSKTEKSKQLFSLKNKKSFYYDVGGTNNLLAVVQDIFLYIFILKKSKQPKLISINYGRQFTAVACHFSEECVITGDNTGRVLLWQGLFEKTATQAVYHWHSLPVETISFSASGTQFYSGGSECVLVKWNIEDFNEKQFLPRLSSSIKHVNIANNNSYIAISAEDNVVHIIDARLQFVSVIQHLVLASQFPAGITYDSRTKALILNGIVGHIQFYTPRDMTLLFNLDITCQNKVTGERDKLLKNTEVSRIAISKNGLWMASVEERDDTGINFEVRLKFWQFNTTKQTFELNTSIEYPHEKQISGVLFQPILVEKDLCCITISDDTKFKIWVKEATDKQFAWRCSGVGYYRNMIPKALAFSFDGSLLAIAFGSMVTMWLPDSCELKYALDYPLYKEDIKNIAFGANNDCHLIVAASDERIIVWNILTLTISWTVAIDCQLLIADPYTNHMALFTKSKKLYVFKPNCSTPIYNSGLKLLKGKGNVLAAAFVPTPYINDISLDWHQRSCLYFIDSNQELYSFDTTEELTVPSQLMSTDIGDSIYKSSLSKMKTTNAKSSAPFVHLFNKNGKYLQDLMYSPNQTKMPVKLLCNSILRSMVLQKEEDKTS